MPPATWQSTSKQSHRAYYHNKPRSAALELYPCRQSKAGGKTRRREMGAWRRELLQAEWWPRGGQGSAPLSTIAASSLIGCIINSAGEDFMGCTACQNTCKHQKLVKYHLLFISSHSACELGKGHSGPGWLVQLGEPASSSEQQQQKQGLGRIAEIQQSWSGLSINEVWVF